jgi:hypothetical protein
VFFIGFLLVVFKCVWVRVNHVCICVFLHITYVFMQLLLPIRAGDIHPQLSSGQPISRGFSKGKSASPEKVFLVPGSAHIFFTC